MGTLVTEPTPSTARIVASCERDALAYRLELRTQSIDAWNFTESLARNADLTASRYRRWTMARQRTLQHPRDEE